MRTNMHCGIVPKANIALTFLTVKIFVVETLQSIEIFLIIRDGAS
jgi:hypothetical protein